MNASVVVITATRANKVAVVDGSIFWTNTDGTTGRANLNGTGVNERFSSRAGPPIFGIALANPESRGRP